MVSYSVWFGNLKDFGLGRIMISFFRNLLRSRGVTLAYE